MEKRSNSQKLNMVNRWPYPIKDYIFRFFWNIVKISIWKVCWHRLYFLRSGLLKMFGSKISWKTLFFSSTKILRPWDLSAGENVAIGQRVHVYNLNKISIGKNTVISQDVYLCGGTHDYTKSTMPLIRKDIVIGESVWIGAGAFISPGLTIGDGAVIGARSVVIKNVEPWSIVGGNPARFIKKREIINDL